MAAKQKKEPLPERDWRADAEARFIERLPVPNHNVRLREMTNAFELHISANGQDATGRDTIEVVVTERGSGSIVAVFACTLAEFSRGTFGTCRDIAARGWVDGYLIGSTSENKQVIVNVPEGMYSRDADALRAILAPLEVDGWRGDTSDLTNGHRSAGRGKQTVTFRRHVWADGSPVLPREKKL